MLLDSTDIGEACDNESPMHQRIYIQIYIHIYFSKFKRR